MVTKTCYRLFYEEWSSYPMKVCSEGEPTVDLVVYVFSLQSHSFILSYFFRTSSSNS